MATNALERGNALYKQSKLPEAIECYEEAALLAPDDAAPFSKLSAAKAAMGQYNEAAELAQKALSLTGDESPSRDKLHLHLARCHLHCLERQLALFHLRCLQHSALYQPSIAKNLRLFRGLPYPVDSIKMLRRDVLDRLPRYKPCLQDEPEYYPIDHDLAASLFDKKLQLAAKSRRENSLSFLMCGIGDARHLWATLLNIAYDSGSFNIPRDVPKELRFTLVDLKPAALARILLVLGLFWQLPSSEPDHGQQTQDHTWAIAYLYVGHVVPPFVHRVLSRSISHLTGVLERNDPNDPLLKWVVMSTNTRKQVLQHLCLWSKPLSALYQPGNTRKVIEAEKDVRMHEMKHGLMDMDLTDIGKTSTELQGDEAIFSKFAITPPPQSFIERHEPDLGPILKLVRSSRLDTREGARRKLDEYINEHWKTNMTLIDLVWDSKKERNLRVNSLPGFEWTKISGMDPDPVGVAMHILGARKSDEFPGYNGVIELVAAYFSLVGEALRHVLKSSSLRLEMIAGEMTDTMERLRHGLTYGRAGMMSPAVWLPQQFDRIHMSNIPDYVGGIFAALEYAPALLKQEDSSFQYNCLLSSPKFKSHEHFLSEHLLMSSKEEISDHFGAELFDPYDGQLHARTTRSYLGDRYWAWRLSNATSKLQWNRLMPRSRVQRWLYAHFLKICLPAERDLDDRAPVYAPPNLTVFMRLLVHLAERGYPAHWLGTVVEDLTSGAIRTTARAPRKEVMNAEDVDKLHPLRQINVAPWAAEFATIVGIWRGLMPFGFVVADGAQVTLADVSEYSVTFPDFAVEKNTLCRPHFILVFYNTDLGGLPNSLRATLLDDEIGENSEKAKEIRTKGIHVVDTFKYVTDTRTASFWMRQDAADGWRQGNWSVSIWRTDSWTKQSGEVPASSHLVKGRSWF